MAIWGLCRRMQQGHTLNGLFRRSIVAVRATGQQQMAPHALPCQLPDSRTRQAQVVQRFLTTQPHSSQAAWHVLHFAMPSHALVDSLTLVLVGTHSNSLSPPIHVNCHLPTCLYIAQARPAAPQTPEADFLTAKAMRDEMEQGISKITSYPIDGALTILTVWWPSERAAGV